MFLHLLSLVKAYFFASLSRIYETACNLVARIVFPVWPVVLVFGVLLCNHLVKHFGVPEGSFERGAKKFFEKVIIKKLTASVRDRKRWTGYFIVENRIWPCPRWRPLKLTLSLEKFLFQQLPDFRDDFRVRHFFLFAAIISIKQFALTSVA